MNMPPIEKSYPIWFIWLHSAIWSLYEIGFALLPGFVWVVVLIVLQKPGDEIYHLPAWPFISVSVFAAMLRDGVRVFSRNNTVSVRSDREISVIVGLTGVVLSSVLLAIGVCRAQGVIAELPSIYHVLVFALLGAGVVVLFVVKTFAIRHTEFKTQA